MGKSEAMLRLFGKIKKVATSDANVLIYGESGTGKELLARALHRRSRRRKHPFVPVDTVALPASLLESELFGYEKGAFTGASAQRRGLFEYADGGTLFLDEISELDLHLQAKFLRVIQEREFRRIGSNDLTSVNVRIIAATNKEPLQAVEDGLLREDLFFRLNVIPFEVPPLRKRREDIPLLARHYAKKFSKSSESGQKKIDQEAMELLQGYRWPGNVRELMNVVEGMVSMTVGRRLRCSDLPDNILRSHPDGQKKPWLLPYAKSKKISLEEFDKEYFKNLLIDCEGNVSKAASKAGVNRKTLYRKINSYNLRSKSIE